MPLRVRGQVVIVQRGNSTYSARHGDWVMYSLEGGVYGHVHEGAALQVESGFGYGPVLAAAGDRVEFRPIHFPSTASRARCCRTCRRRRIIGAGKALVCLAGI